MNTIDNKINIGFWQLISKFSKISKIEIPIIQRDYAQGRKDDKTNKIRNLFLDNLIKVIESDNDSIELDFVYGDIKNGVFQPLDGQQRLTTLFLLHWYFAYKTETLSAHKDNFKKFTYETRISSREFCNELAKKGDTLGRGDTLSEKITDASWFFLSWKKDPTIKAMLVMLNSIESKLNGKSKNELSKLWEKLVSNKPPITFYFKQLNNIGLTDDLYIKMNARGKALTDFENFKARFEKHIKENGFEKELSLTEDNKEQWQELTEQTFSHKIDTVWTDLFWKYREKDNVIDNKFIKFIATIAINYYAQNQNIFRNEEEEAATRKILKEKKGKHITEEAIKRERIEERIRLLFDTPNEVSPKDFPTKESFEYLKVCFDIYANKKNKYDELKPNVLLWDFLEEKKIKINNEEEFENNLFLSSVKETRTKYKPRVLFYAQTQFLLKVETLNSTSFAEWIRVVRNIVQNSTIDRAGTYIGALGLINEISSGCTDIYKFLNESSIKSGFASSQLQEEILKAKLIKQDRIWANQIFKVEDDSFLKGEIRLLLEFSKNDNIFDYEKFKDLSDEFILLFTSKDDLLRIALLTQDDYPIWEGRASSLGWIYRYSLLNKEKEWKDALREQPDRLINAVIKLLNSANRIEGNREDKLNAIIDNYDSQDDYRDLLVKDKMSLKYCYNKRICLNEEERKLYHIKIAITMSKREYIGRYSLIINKLRKSPASFAEISDYLARESELQQYNFNISKRTFQRDLADIRSLYNIDIKFDASARVYFLDFDEKNDFNERILEAFNTFNALNLSDRLSDSIHFEKRRPQGTENLYDLLHAIKKQVQIKFSYKKFWEDEATHRNAEPYALKEFKNRWYVLANDLKDNQIKSFALDRLKDLEITKKRFLFPKDFNVNKHYKYCFGIISPNGHKPKEIELSFDPFQGKYIKTLPLHESQQILIDNEDELRIKLKLFITHDFFMELLSYGNNLRVIKPKSLINELKSSLKNTLKLYD